MNVFVNTYSRKLISVDNSFMKSFSEGTFSLRNTFRHLHGYISHRISHTIIHKKITCITNKIIILNQRYSHKHRLQVSPQLGYL